jgi:hypothetical protein
MTVSLSSRCQFFAQSGKTDRYLPCECRVVVTNMKVSSRRLLFFGYSDRAPLPVTPCGLLHRHLIDDPLHLRSL